MQVGFQLPVRTPSVLVVGNEQEAPAAGTVLAQSNPLQGLLSGFILTAVKFASDSLASFEVAVRSSANEDLAVWLVSPQEAPGVVVCWLNAVNGNYIQVRMKSGGTASVFYQAIIQGFPY